MVYSIAKRGDEMINDNIEIRPLRENELKQFWQVAFSKPEAEWTRWNGPYFHDVLPSSDEFMNHIGPDKWLNNNLHWVILCNNQLVGSLSAYYEDGALERWLDVGIVIYNGNLWGYHIGSKSLRMWINHLFEDVTDLPHIGLTTWSGNKRMMKLADSLDMKLEGQIRQVRYWNGKYFDSIKYGILRSEWLRKT